jgi:FKBP-type peptidyl-prolyl cis-trans isomerase SlpA
MYGTTGSMEVELSTIEAGLSGFFMTTLPVCVRADSFLTLHYRLAGPAGDLINTFSGKPATLSLGSGELAPAVEQCLVGLEEGSRACFELAAGQAFGARNAGMRQWVSSRLLREFGDPQETYQVGDVVHFPAPDGKSRFAGAVLELDRSGPQEMLLFDFNHPLAGQPVTFEVHVIGIL